jgi:hypothetical protein
MLVLDHIAVDTKYQRKGLGTYMLNRAIDIFFEMSEFDFITDNTIFISSLIDTQSMIDIDGDGRMVEVTEPKALKAMLDKYFNSLICSEHPLTSSNKETTVKHQYHKPLKMKNSDYLGWVV